METVFLRAQNIYSAKTYEPKSVKSWKKKHPGLFYVKIIWKTPEIMKFYMP